VIDFRIEPLDAQIRALTGQFSLTRQVIERAARRAVKKAADDVRRAARRRLSAEWSVPRRLVEARLRAYLKDDLHRKLWLGLNALAARRLGAIRKVRGGVRAGQHFFEGAFVSKRGGVYRRVSRNEIEIVRLDIEEPGEQAFREAAREAEEKFMRHMEHELRYELGKAQGRIR
jgi:hypothetical protein